MRLVDVWEGVILAMLKPNGIQTFTYYFSVDSVQQKSWLDMLANKDIAPYRYVAHVAWFKMVVEEDIDGLQTS
jgi:hypothetical protein